MIDHKTKVCFIHIPKNAGQSVERWFLDLHQLDHDDRSELHLFKNDFESGLPRAADHYSYHHYRDHVFGGRVPDDYRMFAIVRDPIARLRSELSYRFHGRIPPRALLRLRSMPMRRMFDDFRCHLQTQSSFLEGAEQGRIDILRLESLNNDFPALMTAYGLPTHCLPRVNSHAGRRRPLPADVVQWGVDSYAEDFENFGYETPDVQLIEAA